MSTLLKPFVIYTLYFPRSWRSISALPTKLANLRVPTQIKRRPMILTMPAEAGDGIPHCGTMQKWKLEGNCSSTIFKPHYMGLCLPYTHLFSTWYTDGVYLIYVILKYIISWQLISCFAKIYNDFLINYFLPFAFLQSSFQRRNILLHESQKQLQ